MVASKSSDLVKLLKYCNNNTQQSTQSAGSTPLRTQTNHHKAYTHTHSLSLTRDKNAYMNKYTPAHGVEQVHEHEHSAHTKQTHHMKHRTHARCAIRGSQECAKQSNATVFRSTIWCGGNCAMTSSSRSGARMFSMGAGPPWYSLFGGFQRGHSRHGKGFSTIPFSTTAMGATDRESSNTGQGMHATTDTHL